MRNLIGLVLLILAPSLSSALVVNETNVADVEARVQVAAMGDIIIHQAQYEKVINETEGFFYLFKRVAPVLLDSQIVYANLEGPTALGVTSDQKFIGDIGFRYDGLVYSGTNFKFNYHPSLITDLQKIGVSVVSTANNHALDRGSIGIDRTIETLVQNSLPFTGTAHTQQPTQPFAITEANGIRIGWLACSEHLNGHSDHKNQVKLCNSQFWNSDFSKLKFENRIDLLIVTPHWGEEYTHEPSANQKQNARRAISNGADAVFGSHPHVVQPWEVVTTSSGRKGFVIYSLGNFVAGQAPLARRTSLVLKLSVVRLKSGEVKISDVNYTPLYRALGTAQVFPLIGEKLNEEQKASVRLLKRLLPENQNN